MGKKKILGRTLKEKQEKNQKKTVVFFFVFFLTIVPLLNINSLIDSSLFSKFAGLSIGLLIFVIIFVVIQKQVRQINFKFFKETVFPVYLLFIVISGLSIINAINVPETFYDLMKNVLFLIFFLISSVLLVNTDNIFLSLCKYISIFTIIILIVGLVQFYNIFAQQYYSVDAAYGITGVFAHKNLYSQMLFMVLPFNIFGIYYSGKPWRVVSFINYVLIIFMIIAIMARSVWVAAFVALFSTVTFLVIIDSESILKEIRKSLLKPVFITILTIIVSVSVIRAISSINATTNRNALDTHLYEIAKLESGNVFNRVAIWTKTLNMISEYPVLGVGGGNWKIQIPKYGVDKEIIMPQKERLQRPHNDYLWVLSENGIPGLITWLGILFISIYYLIKIIRFSKSKEERTFYSLMLFGFIGYATFSFFSFPKERIEHNTYLHFIMAVAVAKHYKLFGTNQNKKTLSNKISLFSIPVILLLLITTYISIKKINGELHLQKAVEKLNSNNNNSVVKEIDKASSWFSTIDPTSTPFKWYKGLALFKMGKTDMAINSFKAAKQVNPFHSNVYNSLGICYASKGEFKTAKEYFYKSTMLKPFSNEANISLAKIYLIENDEARAIEELYKADPDNKNISVTYRKLILKYLNQRVDSLRNTFDKQNIKDVIIFYTESGKDIFNNYKISYKNRIPFEKQLLFFIVEELKSDNKRLQPSDIEIIVNRAKSI